MKKTFLKNLFRDIKKSLSRFLSIVVIIAVGVAFYAGVRATRPSMKISADTYFNRNNFMDFKLISTLGLTKEDVTEIQKINGVTKAEGSYSIDAVIEKDKRQLVLNINSLPGEKDINNIRMIKGRKAEAANEAVVEEKFLEANKLSLGDTIVLKSGNDSNIEESLKNTKFKIVGTAESPLYVSEQRQPSSVGNGMVKGFVYILPEVFKNEIYTVEFKNNTHINLNKITSAINSVIPVLIVSAGVLAFVVIFNLTNINIAERKRELATIKLLGFYNHELAAYIYMENMILTFLGSLTGIPVGIMLNKFIMTTAETNDIMFMQKIGPIYYLVSILLTLLFSVIVNLAMYRRFDKIDMIESLKSAE